MLTRIMILRMMPVIKTMQPTTALAIARCDTNKNFFYCHTLGAMWQCSEHRGVRKKKEKKKNNSKRYNGDSRTDTK